MKFFLVFVLATLAWPVSTAPLAAQDPPTRLGRCCSTAEVHPAPPGAGCMVASCDQKVFSDDPRCSEVGHYSGPAISTGQCEVASTGLECFTCEKTETMTRFLCRWYWCTNWRGYCVWEADGTAQYDYTDCSGNDCWGGAWVEGC